MNPLQPLVRPTLGMPTVALPSGRRHLPERTWLGTRIAWLAGLLLLVTGYVNADVLRGRVVKLADGDSLVMQSDDGLRWRVRLVGIDAPEKGQPFGRASREALKRAVGKQRVELHWDKQDRYERLVGTLWVNGRDVGLEQVRTGMAWHKAYQDEQDRRDRRSYAAAELEARTAQRGLWSEADPVAPWLWRRRQDGTSD